MKIVFYKFRKGWTNKDFKINSISKLLNYQEMSKKYLNFSLREKYSVLKAWLKIVITINELQI